MREKRRVLLLLLVLVQQAEGQQGGGLTVELLDQRPADHRVRANGENRHRDGRSGQHADLHSGS